MAAIAYFPLLHGILKLLVEGKNISIYLNIFVFGIVVSFLALSEKVIFTTAQTYNRVLSITLFLEIVAILDGLW